jgi:hypothetical protein
VETVLRVLTFDGSRLYMEGTRREKVWAVVELAALLTTRLMPAPRVEFVDTVIPTLAGVTSIWPVKTLCTINKSACRRLASNDCRLRCCNLASYV